MTIDLSYDEIIALLVAIDIAREEYRFKGSLSEELYDLKERLEIGLKGE